MGTRKHGHATLLHGLTPEYHSWAGMVARCTNPKHVGYPYYGGRGIGVCDRWREFANFIADMGPRPKGTTLDRIDLAKGYEPGNCRWATSYQQAQNKGKRRNNTSGFTGVSWNREQDKWMAHITRDGRRRFLGYFNDLSDAAVARRNAENGA
jgi:hypothetical protein